MIRVLFIDDDINRVSAAKTFFEKLIADNYDEKVEFAHITFVPKSFAGWDYVSFDNDIIHSDVSSILHRRLWEQETDPMISQGQDLIDEFCDSVSTIFIHTENPVAREKLKNFFNSDVGLMVEVVPFSEMLEVSQNTPLAGFPKC